MKLIINEKQEQLLIGMLLNEEKTYPVEPEKVLVVKKYLDKNYVKGTFSNTDANGDIQNSPIVGAKNPQTGKIEVNLYKSQLFDKVEAKFKDIYEDKVRRTKFLKTVIEYWFKDGISANGQLTGKGNFKGTNKY